MQEEKRRERSFVEHEVRRLIERAAEKFARAKGLSEASVSNDDITEFFRDELRIEPASETQGRLIYKGSVINKFAVSPGAEEDKEDNASLPDNIHERVEFVAESTGDGPWRSKSSYMGQTVGGNLKMLKVRIDKDFKFRIYSSSPVKKGLAIWKMPIALGAMFGAVVGGALGLAFPIRVTSGALNEFAARLAPRIAGVYLIGLAGGVASGALIGLAAAVAFRGADGASIAGVASGALIGLAAAVAFRGADGASIAGVASGALIGLAAAVAFRGADGASIAGVYSGALIKVVVGIASRVGALIGLAPSVAFRSRVASGALIGLAVGVACGAFIGLVAAVASSPLIRIAVGVSCGFGFGFQWSKRKDLITGYDVFSHFEEDDQCLWEVEGRYICRKFNYTYQYFEETAILEGTGNHL